MPTNTVLYVEDDEGEAFLFARTLEEYGYIVEIAKNIREAKTCFDAESHNAIIADWNLPDGEAPELIKTIRSKNESIPILVLSSCYKDEHIETAKNLGVTECVIKDINCRYLQQLPETLKQLIKKQAT